MYLYLLYDIIRFPAKNSLNASIRINIPAKKYYKNILHKCMRVEETYTALEYNSEVALARDKALSITRDYIWFDDYSF